MRDNIILSIVMPFYNRKELVGEMIRSIIDNDFQDYELLAIDDGSTADTVSYIKQVIQSDDHVRIITRNELPKGAPTCRNIGLKEAKGEYIIFFDSDDYITPSCLSTRVAAISKHPELDFMVFPSGTYMNGQFNPNATKFVYGYPINKDDLAGFCRRILPFVVVNNIYRRKALLEKGIEWDCNLKSLQDCDFNVQALTAGLKYDYGNTAPDYGYRIEERGSAVSKGITTRAHYESHLHAIEKIYGLVQAKHGHKYDHDLYYGVLYIFNNIMSAGIDFTFAKNVAEQIKHYNHIHGVLLYIRFYTCHILRLLFSPKTARRIPFGIFIIKHLMKERYIQAKIREIIEKRSL